MKNLTKNIIEICKGIAAGLLAALVLTGMLYIGGNTTYEYIVSEPMDVYGETVYVTCHVENHVFSMSDEEETYYLAETDETMDRLHIGNVTIDFGA